MREVCADLTTITDGTPLSDDLVLITSELATNAVLHSRSGRPAGTFTVRLTLYPDDYAWVEVIDQGGEWTSDRRRQGLTALAAIAGEGNWGVDGDTACRVAWFRLDWPEQRRRTG
ncbi:MAG TPA: ATP-binding protein [Trebonia sp.]|nr:ATP-binding protein [Trebonia sp.]